MNTPKFVWYQLSRDEIPDSTNGPSLYRGKNQDNAPSLIPNSGKVLSAGFSWEALDEIENQAPTAFVLETQSAAETLSWLRVYATEAFPLSQFGRVLSFDDWEMISNQDSPSYSFRDDRWASVVLGELLAQSEQDISLDTISLSRVQACFSIAIARAHKFYDSHKVTRASTERLRAIESDPRFLRRSVNVDALVPIWSLASTNIGPVSDVWELAEFIASAASAYHHKKEHTPVSIEALPQGLRSESIEERVIAFQHLVSLILKTSQTSPNHASQHAAIIAAAAFLVGPGTSHAFLIKKSDKLAPLAQVWFGLIAGLAGRKYWDAAWTKALKGVEKHVKASFSWSDPPISDISWIEHNWITNAIRGPKAFQGISRQVQTSLSIEIFPGVSCQMRLHTDDNRKQSNTTPPVSPPPMETGISPELVAVIEQLHRYAEKAKSIVRMQHPSTEDMFGESGTTKGRRSNKRTKS
ncbi:hypothetical protein VDS46_19675 [Xanthomonas campestris pv. campestris]|uniref:hypothetical protein n=1 Tax=Xanthomonas campestris TaxID=339 RepID=UPI000AA11DE8|nr:hypothetical protein [Xanthomonas campestris]MEB1963165.1 hypothetical protein [Xanthomonas campestris pv. campestris]MEB2229582.1 hypothetical protein [Xanthomonas campestris pv. campestris]